MGHPLLMPPGERKPRREVKCVSLYMLKVGIGSRIRISLAGMTRIQKKVPVGGLGL